MTKKDLYTIAIKIFGLYFLTTFIQDSLELVYVILGSLNAKNFDVTWVIYGSVIFKTVLDLAVFYIATLRTEIVTNKIFSDENKIIKSNLLKADWFELSLAIIGIVLIVYSLPEMLNLIVSRVYYRTNPEDFGMTTGMAPVFYNAFRLIIGIFLILNARNFGKKIVSRGERDDLIDEEK